MVLNLSKIGAGCEPVFIPRKKRKANIAQEIKNTKPAFDPVKDSIAASLSTSRSEDRLPAWRIEKEKNSEKSSEAPTKKLKWTEKTRSEMTERDWRIMRYDLQLKCSTPIQPLLSWSELSNTTLAQSISQKYPNPTPIQRAAINIICHEEKDLIAIAPTGSGKTVGFAVPIIENRVKLALILAPTRELAVQTAEVIESLEQLRVVALVGGHDFESQLTQIEQSDSRIVIVATPGRLLDFMDQKLIDLESCDYLVFDEADRMIDMGFEPQISSIMTHLKDSTNRKTLMFSATWPDEMQVLAKKFLTVNYIKIEAEQKTSTSTPQISQAVELFESEPHKLERLLQCVKQARPPVICFVSTKANAEHIATQLNSRGIASQYLHGGLSQAARGSTIRALRHRTIRCLVATDIASRGVDIPGVSLVVNYNLPASIEIYIHRIGRTGRAGQSGNALSFAMQADASLFPDLRNQLRKSGCRVPNFLQATL